MQGNVMNKRFTGADESDGEQVHDPLTLKNREDLLARITKVHQSIQDGTIGIGILPTIEEKAFKNFFLPAFAGLLREDELRDKMVSHWIRIAGKATQEVNVVDENRRAMFTVPPLQTLDMFDSTDRETIPVAIIFHRLKRYSEYSPKKYDEAIQASLEDSLLNKINPDAVVNLYKRWEQIFIRYRDHLKQLCSTTPELLPWPSDEAPPSAANPGDSPQQGRGPQVIHDEKPKLVDDEDF